MGPNRHPLLSNVVPTTALGALKLYEAQMMQFKEDQEHKEKMKNQFNEDEDQEHKEKMKNQFNEDKDQDQELEQEHTETPFVLDSKIDVTPTTAIMMLAKERLQAMNSKNADVFSIIATCFGETRPEDFDDMEIAVTLQAAAEKVAHKKFSCAKKLLPLCNHTAFKTGNPVQRTVFYFARALKERIDRELGASLKQKSSDSKAIDVRQTQISLNPATIAHQQRFSVVAISQFTGVQSILDNVGTVKKIHLIDLRIRNGWQWTILMQGLAAREFPVELVKITAVGTAKEMMAGTGRWLSSFAKSMDLPFSFHLVVSEMKDLKEDMFKIEPGETVAIYSSVCLFSLVAFPFQLDSLIRVIRNLKPLVMIVNEVDQTTDSPNFNERFTKSLFYVSALFDCISVCGGKDSYRKLAEEIHIWEMIQNIVGAKDTERVFRNKNLSFWRALFRRFGFIETQISSTAICQAKLMVECSPGRSFYNLGMDGKCMTLGWKGTSFEFVSVWKPIRSQRFVRFRSK